MAIPRRRRTLKTCSIRFEVDPRAREGYDFILSGDPHQEGSFVIFRNKAALRVIPERLDMSPLQYFEFLVEGKEISKDDQALLWKLKRRMQNSLSAGLTTSEDILKIRTLVRDQMRSRGLNHEVIFDEWLKMEGGSWNSGAQKEIEILVNMYRSGEYRANPEPFWRGLGNVVRGTDLEAWMEGAFLRDLIAGFKLDLGDQALEDCIFSASGEIGEFGLQARAEARKKRPSAFVRALSKIVEKKYPWESDYDKAQGRIGSERPWARLWPAGASGRFNFGPANRSTLVGFRLVRTLRNP